MRFKVLLIMLVFQAITFASLYSCCPESSPPPDKKYKVGSMRLDVYNGSILQPENDWIPVNAISTDTINYSSYQLVVESTFKTYLALQGETRASWLPQAYACSPELPTTTTDETIDSIQVFVDHAYDSLHGEGAEVSDLLEVFVTQPEFERESYEYKYELTDYAEMKTNPPARLRFFLKSPPDEMKQFTFTIKYYQAGVDGDVFSFIAKAVITP